MTEQEKLPRLLKWAKDGYPPIDLSNEFKAVIELIKYAQQQSGEPGNEAKKDETIQIALKDGIPQIPMGLVFECGGRKFVGLADNRGNNFSITEL